MPTVGLYGQSANVPITYFEWIIFQEAAVAPATPTGGSWSFTTNTGTPPATWSNTAPTAPVNTVWFSTAIVDSRASTLAWTAPQLLVYPLDRTHIIGVLKGDGTSISAATGTDLTTLIGANFVTNATNATNATNLVGSGTVSNTATGGAALTPTNATNAVNATNLVGSGTISATTTGGAGLTPTNATNATNAVNASFSTTQAPYDNSTKIATTAYVDNQVVSGSLPNQTGNTGKFLQTNGSIASWQDVLPSQTNNSGKILSTDGTGPLWSSTKTVNGNSILGSGDIAVQPTFTATGTITAAGVSVALNSDGTVSQIAGSTVAFSAGTVVSPGNRNGSYANAAYDPVNQKVLVVFVFSSAIVGYVGTVSGSTITFGSEYQLITAAGTFSALAYDSTSGKFLLVYATNTPNIRCVALTISGSAISVGAVLTLTSSTAGNTIYCAYSAVANRFLISMTDGANSTFWICSISGTSVVEHLVRTFSPRYLAYVSSICCNPETGNFIVAYMSTAANRYQAFVVPVSVSGGTFAIGTEVPLSGESNGYSTMYPHCEFVGSSQNGYALVVTCFAPSAADSLNVRCGKETMSGIQLGAASVIDDLASASLIRRIVGNAAGSNAAIIYNSGNTIKVTTVSVDKSGGLVIGSTNTLTTTGGGNDVVGFTYDASSGKCVAAYYDTSGSTIRARVITPDGYTTNAKSFIGFAEAAAANGGTVPVATLAAINDNQSGLTLGAKYNLTHTGALTAAETGFPLAGTSIGANKIMVGVWT